MASLGQAKCELQTKQRADFRGSLSLLAYPNSPASRKKHIILFGKRIFKCKQKHMTRVASRVFFLSFEAFFHIFAIDNWPDPPSSPASNLDVTNRRLPKERLEFPTVFFCTKKKGSRLKPWKLEHIKLLLMAEIPNNLGWCWNPVNNGINYQPQLVIAGFQPSTVV